jgi:hypothetical protein
MTGKTYRDWGTRETDFFEIRVVDANGKAEYALGGKA